jgi:sugar-specific transcriptional regulator TrmB
MKEFFFSIRENVKQFESESHELFSKYESSPSRIIFVDQSRKQLKNLSLQQVELFEDSLLCIEQKFYRAAIVMAWAGFIDFLENKISSDGLVKIKQVRPMWVKYNSIEEIRENVATEHEIIKVAKEIGLISKAEMKRLHGELSRRNECAHPSPYRPDLNESLGYVAGLINLIEKISKKMI